MKKSIEEAHDMTTGQRIRMLRKERNLTQKQLAERIGVSTSAVGQFETTKEPQRIETLEKIANALEVPFLYLIGVLDKMPADRDRLTRWNGKKYVLPQGHGAWREIAERLAAYENTGLEPEEIEALKAQVIRDEHAKDGVETWD